jgi:hypothetical protein
LSRSGAGTVTNELSHTLQLNDEFVMRNCLQGVQYYIDFRGQFLYPCDEFPEQAVGSIYEYDIDALYERGRRRFGDYPKRASICGHCPSACHSDNSFILRNPERQLSDLDPGDEPR